MWVFIAGGLAVGVAAVLLLASRQPARFRVERSLLIRAPASQVFALIQDFHAWAQWSPWEKIDPSMQRHHSGAPAGVGAAYEWSGNAKVGAGRMEILQAQAGASLQVKLDFLKPFEAHNLAEFSLQAQGAQTQVIWAMHGPSPFISKVMGLFVSMDKMIGKDFEAGLANLKAVVEK